MNTFPNILLFFSLISPLTIHATPTPTDTINISQIIRDGETLVSSGGLFEFGFFSPGNSTNRYIGIWYNNIKAKTYVWVANRDSPLTTKSGVLKVTNPGILLLLNESNSTIWSSNTSRTATNPAVQLLDSGNLVVKDADDDGSDAQSFLWQSFDHPTDTYLPGMMSLGWNLETGEETYLSSWKNQDDPGRGEFTAHLDPTGYPQIVVRRGKSVKFRLGPWNGVRFSGSPGTRNNPTLRMNKNEVKYGEDNVDKSVITRLTMSLHGVGVRWIWNNQSGSWITYNLEADDCDSYNSCGAYASCNVGSNPRCGCLDRFVAINEERWSRGDWSGGCVARTPLRCEGDVFVKYSGIKLPDARNGSFNDQKMLLSDCEVECSRNCSCTAYKQLDIREETSGCLFYHGELHDVRAMASGGEELYIRIAADDNDPSYRRSKRVKLIVSLASVAGLVFICTFLVLLCVWNRKKDSNARKEAEFSGSLGKEAADLPFFSLSAILTATENFSISNKLGEGGFGPVYKGVLEKGPEIAVKRLSKTSKQGVNELKNEVILIAKLQHRNLVRTLGCCVNGEESMVIYEYMPNSSLDLILFDETKSMLLDWGRRFNIINGIAKGLLYLHQDSRLRIIHRDLKASNILLDADMNPKISDFGLARIFGGNETEAQTRRVVGTYGYMSPEYAIDGLFSVKSDVFSFGVLVLEIASGKRNRGFCLKDHSLNLLGHAWTLYKEGKSCELVDASLGESFELSEVLRSIQVGLLCVQKCAEDRPSMSSVVFMLGNQVELPRAKEPGFFVGRDVLGGQSSSSSNATVSENQVSITWTDGR